MVSPGAIRAGGVYIEIGGDDSPLERTMAATQARLRAWVAQNQAQFTKATEGALSGEAGGGFLSGAGFRGADIAGTGLKVMTFVKGMEAVVGTAKIFSAALDGDTAAVRKLGEALPLFGQLVPILGPLADSAANRLWSKAGHDLTGAYDVGATQRSNKARADQAKGWNEGLRVIKDQEQAFRKLTMSARDFFVWQMQSKGVGKAQVDQALEQRAINTSLENSEHRLNAERSTAEEQAGQAERSVKQSNLEYARATLSAREFVVAQIEAADWSKEQTAAATAAALVAFDATQKKIAGEKAFRAELQATADADRKAAAEFQHNLDLRFSREMDLVEKANRVHEETMSPKERFENKQGELQELLGLGLIDKPEYNKAIRQALERAARALPDIVDAVTRYSSRGTFNGLEAQMGMDAGSSAAERTAKAAEKTADHTESMDRKLDKAGIVPVWN